MDFLQRTPFFRLLLPFIVGILLYQYVEFYQWTLYVLIFTSISLIITSFLLRKSTTQYKFRWLFGCGIFLFMLTLSYLLSAKHKHENEFSALNQSGIYIVELNAPPIEKAKSFLCKVDVLQYFNTDSWTPTKGKAILYFQKDSVATKLLFGDRLFVKANFLPPPKNQNPNGFNYAAYLNRQGIGATSYMSSGNWQVIDRNTSFSIRREADKCRKFLLNIYREFKIDGNEFAVLAALTLGYTDDLQPDLRASYSASGAMHILSVSGMHVGVVYVVIAFLLSFLNKNQRQRVFKVIFIALFLWTYAFVTGLSPAVIRATLMFTFVAVAGCFNRKSLIYNSIFMSVLVMLIYNPNFLFDVGFQLSYSAVLSIIYFQPIISKLLSPKGKIAIFFWDLLAVSVAAQIATTPFTLYYFQQFPSYFLLTNFVAIPLSTVVIYLAIALLLLSSIPYLSIAIAFLLKWSLWLLNFLIVWIQHLPYSVSQLSVDFSQMLVLFCIVFFFSFYFYYKKIGYLYLGLSAVLVASLLVLQVNFRTLTSQRMIVYAGMNHTHVNFVSSKQNYIYTTDSIEASKLAKPFWKTELLNDPVFLKNNSWFMDGFVSFQGARIFILTKEILHKKTKFAPLELDYLIVGNGLKPKIKELLETFNPRKIIVDNSISTWYTKSIEQECALRKIDFYSVADKGAYVLNFID